MISKDFIAMCAATTMLASPAFAANLVVNGDFEANPGNGSISGWTVTGFGIADDQEFPNGGFHSAVFLSLYGDPNAGGLSQDLTTVIGQDYRLVFSLFKQGNGQGDNFSVIFGDFDASINGFEASADRNGPVYTAFTFEIDGSLITSANTTLTFLGLSSPSSASPFNLDDVSVSAAVIPEPSQWLLMISGFALTGAALRRRNRALAVQATLRT